MPDWDDCAEDDPGLPLDVLAPPYSAALAWLAARDGVPMTPEALADATADNLARMARGEDAEERTVDVERLGLTPDELERYVRRVQQRAPHYGPLGRRAE